jgi:hypothetical protein
MKKCPQCQSLYTDDTLSYCLSDGTTLIFDTESSEATLQLPENAITQAIPVQTESSVKTQPIQQQTVSTQGVSSVWLYSTIGLLALLLIGGGIGIGFWLNGSDWGTAKTPTPTPQPEKSVTPQTPTPTPEKQTQFQPSPTAQPNLPTTPKVTATPTVTPTFTPTPPPSNGGYRVVGVAGHDVLYLRPAPGNLKSFLAKIPPNASGIQVTGGGVKVGKATWYPVNYNGTQGWVNGRFIAKS